MIVSPTDASRPGWFETARRLNGLPVWAQYALATNLLISILLVGYGLVGDGDLRSRKFQHQWMTDRYSRLEVSTSSPPSRDRARDLRGTVGSHLTMRLPVHFYE